MQIESSCLTCKHYIEGVKCKAFDIIPNEIIEGSNPHEIVDYRQDNDIVFESIDD